MNTRILPPEEWHRLIGTEAESVWHAYVPENTQVIVVEDEGRIVATWTALRIVHAECLWIDPAYRGSFGIFKRLINAMNGAVRGWSAQRFITGSVSEAVTKIIGRLGGEKLAVDMFVVPVQEEVCRPH